ncbi:hypothetical protein HBH64_173340 [Parastagonospora nodorum]|nr:hypothetical protein HBH64_173340 [Parastagonospora nodorum]KAH4805788.1 hypothetical protein HBH61_154240 [Parastagonospora nodorum]
MTTVVVVGIPELSTITSTSGSVSFTSTVPTTDLSGSPTTVVVVGEPTPFSTITSTTGSIRFTSTVATTDPAGSLTTVVVVGIPELSTITSTSGSVSFTSTVPTTDLSGSPTTVVVVGEPTPFSTITSTTGSIRFTSTVATTDPAGSLTTVVVVGVPVLSTITRTSGTTGLTSTVASTDPTGGPTSVVVVNVPIPSNACFLPETVACDSTGLDLAFYANNIVSAQSYGAGDVSPDYYFGLTPLGTGTTNDLTVPRVNNPGGDYTTIPGAPFYFPGVTARYAGIDYNPNNGTFVFNGYFRPPTDGVYEICINSDNIDTLYLGPATAFACGGTAPIPQAQETLATLNQRTCVNETLGAGFLYPLRSVYGMNGLPSLLSTNITFPGTTSPGNLAGTLYPQSCQPVA